MVGGSGEERNINKTNVPHKKKKKQKGKAVPLAPPPPKPKKAEGKPKHPPGDKSTKYMGSSPYFSSTSDSLELIKSYHTLNKRLEQNARDASLTDKERQREGEKIKEEQQALGGIERYQQASMYGAKSKQFNCASWVEPLLKEHFFGKSTLKRELLFAPGITSLSNSGNY
jgi:hypothetical protein